MAGSIINQIESGATLGLQVGGGNTMVVKTFEGFWDSIPPDLCQKGLTIIVNNYFSGRGDGGNGGTSPSSSIGDGSTSSTECFSDRSQEERTRVTNPNCRKRKSSSEKRKMPLRKCKKLLDKTVPRGGVS